MFENVRMPLNLFTNTLLFNIFINDVSRVSQFIKLLLFTDDLKVLLSISSLAKRLLVAISSKSLRSPGHCKLTIFLNVVNLFQFYAQPNSICNSLPLNSQISVDDLRVIFSPNLQTVDCILDYF